MKTVKVLRILTLVLASVSMFVGAFPVKAPAGPIVYNTPNALTNIGGQDVWLFYPDGSQPPQPLFQLNLSSQSILLSARNPVWSRDGRHIAAVGLISPTPQTTLFDPITKAPLSQGGYSIIVFDYPTLGARLVASLGTALDDGVYTAFSPDGMRLAYVNPGGNFSEFYVTSLNGTQQTQPTLVGTWSIVDSEGITGTGIDWSPAEDQLVIPISIPASISGPSSGQALCSVSPQQLLNLLHSQQLPVPVTPLFLVPPVPNGLCHGAQQLTFPSYSFNPYVDQSNLSSLLAPIASVATDTFPVFSHDGTKVVFVRQTKTISWLSPNQMTLSIRVVDVSCSEKFHSPQCEREVVSSAVPDLAVCGLSWSVDQTKIVFGLGHLVYGAGALNCDAGLWTVSLDPNLAPTSVNALNVAPGQYPSSPSWSWGP